MYFKLDGKEIVYNREDTILSAAEKCGIKIPNLCFLKNKDCSGCMVCVVQDREGKTIASCNEKPVENENYFFNNNDIQKVRKESLDMLLSEHKGECYSPCSSACPAGLDISLLMEKIYHNQNCSQVLYNALPFGKIICKYCSKPCQKVCRKGIVDKSVRIVDEISKIDFEIPDPRIKKETVLIYVNSFSGLVAAYYFAIEYQNVDIILDREKVLNQLSDSSDLESIIDILLKLSVNVLSTESKIDKKHNIKISNGDLLNDKSVPRTVSSVRNFLLSNHIQKKYQSVISGYKHKLGKLSETDIDIWLKNQKKLHPLIDNGNNNTGCLLCGCKSRFCCDLKELSEEYVADNKTYMVDKREKLSQSKNLGGLIFDNDKCIKCGKCISLTKEKSSTPLAFYKRGWHTTIILANSDKNFEKEVITNILEVCPTGAMESV